MKKTFPNTKIGTADSWSSWNNGSMDAVIRGPIDLAYDFNTHSNLPITDMTQSCERVSLLAIPRH